NNVFEQGDRHEDIIQIKKDLHKVGFGGMDINDLYGSFTEKQVKKFQKYFNLKSNGKMNQKTQSKLNSTANSIFQEGKRHKDIIQLKKDLKKAGFGGMNISDLYGSYTAKRVKDLQKKHGLKVNGIADEVTLKKIDALVEQESKKKVVYLDAGHGGYDPGSGAYGLNEKDLTLDIAKRTRKQLENAGFKV